MVMSKKKKTNIKLIIFASICAIIYLLIGVCKTPIIENT